ncbi:MAG TPA: response regulator [Usitatibacter sp.]|nr:response regulator [Usitatibacter sp.]
MHSARLIVNVDDDDAARYVKSRILKHAGFDVLEAATGAAALEHVRERGPGLVLLDVKLPDLNGREVCAMIKQDPSLAGVVVLLTSASHIELRHRVAALEAGADGYLVEPMEPEELVANVRALLRMRQAERERQAALEALREADRRKDQFLAMLAHELRNPLAPIRNAVEILRRSEDRDTLVRARELIGRQAEHLARLVDDLLEVSRITQGKLVLQRGHVSLQSLVESAVEVARPLIDKNAQRLELSLPKDDLWLHVDPVRMSQVIGNVLHNASKFTPGGGRITVGAQLEASGLQISVTDEGMGIAADMLGSVFELFSQGDRSLDRAQGGLGIGLSLVRGLVEMHGGTVVAQSEGPGRGSRFVITLPREVVSAAPPEPARAAARDRGRPRRVLVVEDNPDAAEAMRMLLVQLGHQVASASSGHEALEVARDFRPEVVLLDIGLPGLDGYEVARMLRSLDETRHARVIAVTGYGQPADRQRSSAAGFDRHLVKPVDPAKLAEAIDPDVVLED